jgi:hypothetical protein
MEQRAKTSIGMKTSTKNRLERLKVRLRSAGIERAVASEAAIVEALIATADFALLFDYFRRKHTV